MADFQPHWFSLESLYDQKEMIGRTTTLELVDEMLGCCNDDFAEPTVYVNPNDWTPRPFGDRAPRSFRFYPIIVRDAYGNARIIHKRV